MTITLPSPPSLNNLYATGRHGKRFLSPRGKAFKASCAMLACAAGMRPIEGLVTVEYTVYRPRKVGDVDGYAKALLDGLKGFAFHDDAQVKRIVGQWEDDKHNPRAVVTVRPFSEPIHPSPIAGHSPLMRSQEPCPRSF